MSLPLPIWQHLPPHFKEGVVSNLDYRSRIIFRFRLRVCSRAEKNLIDSCASRIDFLSFSLTEPAFNSPNTETPAEISIKDKSTEFSKQFKTDDAVEHLLSIFSSDLLTLDTLEFRVWGLHRNGAQFKFFKKFLNEIQSRNITIKVRCLELLTTFQDKNQFVSFIKCLDVGHIQSMNLKMATACQVDNIAKTEQWMKLKELRVDTRHEFNIDRISHLEKVQIKVKRLSGEAISQLIQSFITRNQTRGSFFSVSTWLPIVNSRILLSTILERLPAPRENENGFDGHLHTQKIPLANPDNVFIVILSPSNLCGVVCNVDSFQQEAELFLSTHQSI
ncbi:hypothetical protein CAEBREN_22436 [Caenorhabditis brenneri]|uniref:DUF38 domain-containing protein n=1 Tax=Caenorhabditis brenneri TaxID=135651 RepID=G0N9X1_CAEBE|nr:hypothetical protein CAEBREN_22436 [Caenorhabditis brenneri]